MAPLLRTTLALRGHTPMQGQQARHREKVSVAGALWKTPCGLVRMAYQTYPNQYLNNQRYAEFLEQLLEERLRRVPVILLHDRATMHRGEPLADLEHDIDWLLGFEPLPPYAPELNPVEEMWNYLKYDELPNFAPHAVMELDQAIHRTLLPLHREQTRLRTFLANTPLKW